MFKKKYAKGGVLKGGSGVDHTPDGEWIIPLPRFVTVEMAIEYIKGYCNKHQNCDERCRLYDTEDGACMFYDAYAGTPCDWDLPKRKEENGEK